MTLLSPMFLWAFALVAPLVAVYLLKVRPRRKPTTALFLWERVFTEKRSTALLRRLRDVLSLLLMLAALTAAVLAMTRPRLASLDRRDVLILIDNSASMSAIDGSGTRLDDAKSEALGIVRALGPGRRAAVATVSDRLSYRCYLTDNPRRLREAIHAISPGQTPSRAAAIKPLGEVAGLGDRLRVLLLSDSVGAGFALPRGVELMKIAGHVDNAGIVAADLVVSPGGGRLTLMFRLASSFKAKRDVEVELYHAGQAVKIIPIKLTPGLSKPQVSQLAAGGGGPVDTGRYELRLKLDDALAVDNTAYLWAPAPHPVRVRIAAPDPYFFQQAISAFARSDGRLALARDGQRADLTLERGGVHDDVEGEGNLAVVFDPAAGSPWVKSVGEAIPTPLPHDLAPGNAALRWVPVESLPFAGAKRDAAPDGSAVLVEDQASGAPLVWQTRRDGRVALVFNMDPAAGDFVLSPFFPVMIHAAATHLGGQAQPIAATHRVGDAVAPPGVRPGQRARITFTDGRTTEVGAGEPVALEHAGFARVKTPTGETDLAASLVDSAETRLSATQATSTAEPIRSGFPPWVWLTWLVIVVLVAEECLYHRRKVG